MPLSNSHYLHHLTEVSKQGKVVLSEDILNENGVLVVKKGAIVDRELTYKVAKHKLRKPIDTSIALTKSLNYQQILDNLMTNLDKLSVLDIAKKSEYFGSLLQAFKALFKYPLVIQKISILVQRMPATYARALSSSALCLGVCKELALPNETTENVFVANMISDVGLLHINPEVVEKRGNYTEQEWKLMQGHVAIAKHFADQVPALSKSVSRGLLEHHERNDGFGYPFGKKGDDISIEGQVLSIIDKVNGLSKKLIHHQSYSWNALLHIMQIPSTAHAAPVHNAMIRLLKKLKFPYQPAFTHSQYLQHAKECLVKRKRLQLWFTEFEKIYVNHAALAEASDEFDAVGLLHKLEHTVHNTGILNNTQHKWLTALCTDMGPQDYIELEEYMLLLNEVEFRCGFVLRQLESHKEAFAKRIGSIELLLTYHEGLCNILYN